MSKIPFTKGPWEVVDYNYGDPARETWLGIIRGAFEILDERFQVGRIKYSALPLEENKANATLIAAAPELLEALEDMRDEFVTGHDSICECDACDTWRQADRLIDRFYTDAPTTPNER